MISDKPFEINFLSVLGLRRNGYSVHKPQWLTMVFAETTPAKRRFLAQAPYLPLDLNSRKSLRSLSERSRLEGI